MVYKKSIKKTIKNTNGKNKQKKQKIIGRKKTRKIRRFVKRGGKGSDILYVVKNEIRGYSIDAEIRGYSIDAEIRGHSIDAENVNLILKNNDLNNGEDFYDALFKIFNLKPYNREKRKRIQQEFSFPMRYFTTEKYKNTKKPSGELVPTAYDIILKIFLATRIKRYIEENPKTDISENNIQFMNKYIDVNKIEDTINKFIEKYPELIIENKESATLQKEEPEF